MTRHECARSLDSDESRIRRSCSALHDGVRLDGEDVWAFASTRALDGLSDLSSFRARWHRSTSTSATSSPSSGRDGRAAQRTKAAHSRGTHDECVAVVSSLLPVFSPDAIELDTEGAKAAQRDRWCFLGASRSSRSTSRPPEATGRDCRDVYREAAGSAGAAAARAGTPSATPIPPSPPQPVGPRTGTPGGPTHEGTPSLRALRQGRHHARPVLVEVRAAVLESDVVSGLRHGPWPLPEPVGVDVLPHSASTLSRACGKADHHAVLRDEARRRCRRRGESNRCGPGESGPRSKLRACVRHQIRSHALQRVPGPRIPVPPCASTSCRGARVCVSATGGTRAPPRARHHQSQGCQKDRGGGAVRHASQYGSGGILGPGARNQKAASSSMAFRMSAVCGRMNSSSSGA